MRIFAVDRSRLTGHSLQIRVKICYVRSEFSRLLNLELFLRGRELIALDSSDPCLPWTSLGSIPVAWQVHYDWSQRALLWSILSFDLATCPWIVDVYSERGKTMDLWQTGWLLVRLPRCAAGYFRCIIVCLLSARSTWPIVCKVNAPILHWTTLSLNSQISYVSSSSSSSICFTTSW